MRRLSAPSLMLLSCLLGCAPTHTPTRLSDAPALAERSELLATWGGRVRIYRHDYLSWLAWRGLEPEPRHLTDFAVSMVLAQLTREREQDHALEQQVRERVLGNALLARIDIAAQVDEAEVDAAVAAQVGNVQHTRRYQLRNLFLTLPQDPAGQAQTRMRIESLRHRALAGEDFAALATEYSQSQTRFREGRVGLLSLERLPAAVAEAVAPLREGEISAIVEAGGGLSIYYCERVVEAQAPDPEALRQQIRQRLQREALARARAALDRELLAERGLNADTPAAVDELPELRAQRAVVTGLADSAEIALDIRWRTMQEQARLEMARQIESRRGTADDSMLRETFSRMQGRGEGMTRYRVGGIALGPPTSERVDTARRLLERIQNGDLTFEDAARSHSLDASAESGGDLGWFNVRRLADRDWMMMRAIRSIQPGELSGLMHSSDGLWIYRLLDRQSGEQVRFEDVRSELEERMAVSQTRALQRAIRSEISRDLVLADL